MRALGVLMFLFLLLAPLAGHADPVDPAGVTTFQNGQPADADELNATLQALISAIDDNAARVAALEAGGPAPGPESVLGTWKVFGLEVEAAGRDDDHAGWAGGFRIENTLILGVNPGDPSADPPILPTNTFSLTGSDAGVRMMVSVFKGPCDFDIPEGAECVGETWVSDLAESEGDSGSGTWSVAGDILTLSFDPEPGETVGEDVTFTLAANGSLFIQTYVEDDAFPDSGSTMHNRLLGLSIGVKGSDPAL